MCPPAPQTDFCDLHGPTFNPLQGPRALSGEGRALGPVLGDFTNIRSLWTPGVLGFLPTEWRAPLFEPGFQSHLPDLQLVTPGPSGVKITTPPTGSICKARASVLQVDSGCPVSQSSLGPPATPWSPTLPAGSLPLSSTAWKVWEPLWGPPSPSCHTLPSVPLLSPSPLVTSQAAGTHMASASPRARPWAPSPPTGSSTVALPLEGYGRPLWLE